MWQPPAGLAPRTRQAAALQSEHKLLLARRGRESRLQQRDGDLRLGCAPVVGKHEGQVAAVAAAPAVGSARMRHTRRSLRGVRRLVSRRRRRLCGCHDCTNTRPVHEGPCEARPCVVFVFGRPEKRPSLERLLLRHNARMTDQTGGDAAGVEFRQYQDESGACRLPSDTLCRPLTRNHRRVNSASLDLVHVQGLVDPQLSEPYSVFTYRYFLAAWPHLCFMVRP